MLLLTTDKVRAIASFGQYSKLSYTKPLAEQRPSLQFYESKKNEPTFRFCDSPGSRRMSSLMAQPSNESLKVNIKINGSLPKAAEKAHSKQKTH